MTIEPFTINIADRTLDRLQTAVERFEFDRIPDAGGWQSGVGIETMQCLVHHWRKRFDWRAIEARLNHLPHFVTDIAGQRIHFVHAKAEDRDSRRDARAMLLVHGWPGSFLEFVDLIEPLTDPVASGDRNAAPVDVIIPSLPGFAFSGGLRTPVGPRRVAAIFHRLMTQTLGYKRFVVQGGDWGAAIAGWLAHDFPESVAGIHLNMVLVQREDASPETDAETRWAAERKAVFAEERAYAHLQGTRPQTLAFAMSDSPVGVAAWITEKFGAWSDIPTTTDGTPDVIGAFGADVLLTNIMLYLVTDAFPTATWIYRGRILENSSSFASGTQITVPTGIAAFPDPVFAPPPRSLVEKTYPVAHWSEPDRGGHFAALEQPDTLLADLRSFLAKL